MGKNTMNGAGVRRAFEYAFRVCPKKVGGELSHVVIMSDRVICGDGSRWQTGYFPSGGRFVRKPIAVARQSVKMLLLGLEYAHAMVGGVKGEFFVEYDSLVVTIRYGKKTIEHELVQSTEIDPETLPESFEPISEDAPMVMGIPTYLHAGHLADAIDRMTSWGVDHARVMLRGRGGKDPVRVDVVGADDSDRVGTAFILPMDAPPAVLPPNEPLLKGIAAPKGSAQPGGQSILHLRTDLFVQSDAAAGGEDGDIVDAEIPDGEDVTDGMPIGDEKPKRVRKKATAKKKRKR